MKAEKRKELATSLAVAVVAALFFCVVVPLQTYLGNSTSFDYGTGRIAGEMSAAWLLCTTALFAVLASLRKPFGAVPHALLLAFVVYEYLATGVMTIGFPTLDGETFFYSDLTRRIVDCSVCAGLMLLALVFYRWLKGKLVLASIIVAVMSIASVFDVNRNMLPEATDLDTPFANGFASRSEVAKSAFFSSKRNVLVFVLDSVTSEVFEDVVRNEPEFCNAFDGFTVYRDNVGMHPNTTLGVPGMVTGRLYDGSGSIGDYVAGVYSDKSAFYPYLTSDVPMFVQAGCFERFGFANRRKSIDADAGNDDIKGLAFLRRIGGQQAWNLYEIVRFRLTPFLLKGRILRITMAGWEVNRDMNGEETLYPIIADAPVSEDEPTVLQFWHTRGCHVPYTTNRDGKQCQAMEGYAGAYEKTIFALRQLAKLFETLKTKGVYGKSLLIVTADHGNYDTKKRQCHGVDLKEHPIVNRALPCLAVKAEDAEGDIRWCNTPTAHSKLSKLMTAARGKKLRTDEIDSLLAAKGARVFRAYVQGRWQEWTFMPDGTVTNRPFKSKIDIEKLVPVQLEKTISLKNSETQGKSAPVVFEGVDASFVTAPLFCGGEMVLSFKVEDASAAYDVDILMGAKAKDKENHAGIVGRLAMEGAAPVDFTDASLKTVIAKGLRPYGNGVLTIRGNMRDAKCDLLILSLKVAKAQ